MLKLLEVYDNPDSEGNREELATMDVTTLTEKEQGEALDAARVLYGDVLYQWHSCLGTMRVCPALLRRLANQ